MGAFFIGSYGGLLGLTPIYKNSCGHPCIQSAVTAECECTIKIFDESNHCHEICRTGVSKAVAKLKSDKISDNGLVYSNNFINGTSFLYKSLSILFSSMIYHGFAPQAFICANIIPIPKGSKASLTSDVVPL